MRIFAFFSLVLMLALSCPPAAFSADGPAPANPCSCTYWTPTSGSGELTSMTITLEASTVVTTEDRYFLKLVDRQGKSVYYIRLTIPEGGKNEVQVTFDPPLTANQPFMGVLFCPDKDIAMTYLKVTGQVSGEEVVYFDYGCAGVVIGPGGCKYMELR